MGLLGMFFLVEGSGIVLGWVCVVLGWFTGDGIL